MKKAKSSSQKNAVKHEISHGEKLWETFLRQNIFGVIELSRDGHIHFANQWAKQILKVDDGLKIRWNQVFPFSIVEQLEALWHGAHEIFHSEFSPRIRDGEFESNSISKTLRLHVSKLNSNDEHSNLLAVIEDLSSLKAIERKVADANEKTLISLRTRAAFLSHMSHEIRTPMNSIIGTADLLSDTKLDDEQKKYVDTFKSAGRSLLVVLNDILNITKIESGQVPLEKSLIYPERLVQEVVDVLKWNITERKIQLKIELDEKTPKVFLSDLARLRQILSNLVSNAIKFTHEGVIEIGISRPTRERKGNVLFWVRDSGKGLDTTMAARIFEPVIKNESQMSRRYGGMGLGLAIAKRLVERLGGEMWVESRVDVGSCFYFTLQVDEQVEKLNLQSKEITLKVNQLPEFIRPLRLLIVDDNLDNQKLIKAYLNHAPVDCTFADDGEQAVMMWQQAHYDLILMDMEMPVMDGFSATRAIRDLEESSGRDKTSIVALSAYSLDEEIARSLQAGCDGHLSKPISKSTLLGYLTHFATQLGLVRRQVG